VILLVTPAQRAPDCAACLEDATGESVVIAQSLLEASTHLRADSYTATIFDHHLIEAEPYEYEIALAQLGDAVSLDINLALTGIDSLVREVQFVLKRCERNDSAVRAAAARSLYGNLNEALTTLLLDCGLALEIPNLPPAATEKLASISESVQNLRRQIDTAASVKG
jgi:hypothetical protein